MRLVLSPVEPGSRRIMAGTRQVGLALTEWDDRDKWNGAWRARLWGTPFEYDTQVAVTGKFLRLRDLRADLERRLAEDGPWWK